ncbi:MAG: hypothetical protein ABSG68_21805, partial [Thermoguttaceae bacterium]
MSGTSHIRRDPIELPMRIAVLHPAVAQNASPEDQDSLVQVEVVAEALKTLGHEPIAVACTLDLSTLGDVLARHRCDVVFNLVESVDGADSLQYVPPALLDVLNLPYTGAPTEAIFQTTHKLLAKQLLHLAGLPTPPWSVAGTGSQGSDVPAAPQMGTGSERSDVPVPFCPGEQQVLRMALVGLYKTAGAELLRRQIESALPQPTPAYDVTEE